MSKLSEFAGTLVAKNHFIKASFGGFAGSGKTRTASEFVSGVYKDTKCTKQILVIDNEKGSRFLIPFFKQQGIETLVKDTIQLGDIIQAIDFLKSGEIDFLFIDSLTKVWYKYIRDYREKNKKTFMTLQDWGKILPAWQEEFSDRFVDCPGNIVFTGRGGFTYEMEETETAEGKTKREFVKSGVKMKLAGETPFEPDLNVWMELQQDITTEGLKIWRESQIMKDRSGLIDGKTFKNPTYKDFKPVVDFLLQVPTGLVSGATNTNNLAPSEDYGYIQRQTAKEIEMEKIKAIFDKAKFGRTDEDKQLKVLIYEKVFGTTSMTEFEKRDAENMKKNRIVLETLFRDWDGIDGYANKLEFVKKFRVDKVELNEQKDDLPF